MIHETVFIAEGAHIVGDITIGEDCKTETIYERVWGQPYFENNNTVMVHIRKLREKIEENPRDPLYVFTVWGVGYKFGID